ncbi:MAG TPA: hypothetical protein VGF55_15835, partial [Gemmataceae bacterium]
IEWNRPLVRDGRETGNRELFVLDKPHPPWTREGVPPQAKIDCFQKPRTKHLDMRPEDQRRNAYQEPWHLPKVILNAARRSRGPWRISAFADSEGLTCYRTFLAVWPHDPTLTTAFAAVLNGPIANAFSARREGLYIPLDVLEAIPVPAFPAPLLKQIEDAVGDYRAAAGVADWSAASSALRRIDALTLKAYRLPPRLERMVLDYFNGFGHQRPVPFDFGDYFPKDFTPTVPLYMYLSPEFRKSTARNLSEVAPRVTDPELVQALEEVE